MTDRVIRVAAGDDDVAAAGALTAEAYHADGLIDDGDEYLEELLDAARRAREATLLVALVPADPWHERDDDASDEADDGAPRAGVALRAAARTRGRSHTAGMALVGTVTLAPAGSSYAEIADPGEVEVRMLAVAPEARRRGIAEALTRAAMLEAVSLGAERVVLSTLDAMKTAHRLYDRLGFVRLPERDWHHEGVALRVYTWAVPRGPGVRVETAMWRPREVREVGGWRVGLSGGFTRRANSVVALAEPEDVPASIDEVERIYAGHRLPATFRVCAQSRPDDLDDLLRERGYRDVSHTLVMVRESLEEGVVPAAEDPEPGALGTLDEVSRVVTDEPDEEWLSGWLAVRTAHPVDHELAAAVLSGVRAVYVRALDAGATIGVVRAALVGDWVGLSCLGVHPDARRQGIGRALTIEALRVAAERGACHAFLQVQESNESAIALYGQLGFAPAERYHYRER